MSVDLDQRKRKHSEHEENKQGLALDGLGPIRTWNFLNFLTLMKIL